MEADVAQGEVQLGPVLKVSRTEQCSLQGREYLCNDDLSHIGKRYGVAVKDLLWWNPDIAGDPHNSPLFRIAARAVRSSQLVMYFRADHSSF